MTAPMPRFDPTREEGGEGGETAPSSQSLLEALNTRRHLQIKSPKKSVESVEDTCDQEESKKKRKRRSKSDGVDDTKQNKAKHMKMELKDDEAKNIEIDSGEHTNVDNSMETESENIVKKKKSKKHKRRESRRLAVEEMLKDFAPEEDSGKRVKFEEDNEEEDDGDSFAAIGQAKAKKLRALPRALPLWLRAPVGVSGDVRGASRPLPPPPLLAPPLAAVLRGQGVTSLFPVQLALIPHVLREARAVRLRAPRSLCLAAATGSGKTLAYGCPLLQVVAANGVRGVAGALLLLPSEALAAQILRVLRPLAAAVGVVVCSAVGAASFGHEQRDLATAAKGPAFVVVGTPARVRAHLKLSEGFDLTYLRFLVFDEVDQLLNSDECQWVSSLVKSIKLLKKTAAESDPFNAPLPMQKILVSATLTSDPEKLYALDLYRPLLLTTKVAAREEASQDAEKASKEKGKKQQKQSSSAVARPSSLKEKYVVVSADTQPVALHHLILRHGWKSVLVFVSTRDDAHRLSLVLGHLAGEDYTVQEFSSKAAANPAKIVRDFDSGATRVLVSTDALSRGVDLREVAAVVSYGRPRDAATHVHRAGRTARAGRPGLCLTMLLPSQPHKAFIEMARRGGSAGVSRVALEAQELQQYAGRYEQALGLLRGAVEREAKAERRAGKRPSKA